MLHIHVAFVWVVSSITNRPTHTHFPVFKRKENSKVHQTTVVIIIAYKWIFIKWVRQPTNIHVKFILTNEITRKYTLFWNTKEMTFEEMCNNFFWIEIFGREIKAFELNHLYVAVNRNGCYVSSYEWNVCHVQFSDHYIYLHPY